jgi:hypothetical protein
MGGVDFKTFWESDALLFAVFFRYGFKSYDLIVARVFKRKIKHA